MFNSFRGQLGIFKEFDFKVRTFVDSLAQLKVTRINLSSLHNSAGLEIFLKSFYDNECLL